MSTWLTSGCESSSSDCRSASIAPSAARCSDPSLLTARHTIVEVRRNLAQLLRERDATAAKAAFTQDVAAFAIVELDAVTCDAAADVAELTGGGRATRCTSRPRDGPAGDRRSRSRRSTCVGRRRRGRWV